MTSKKPLSYFLEGLCWIAITANYIIGIPLLLTPSAILITAIAMLPIGPLSVIGIIFGVAMGIGLLALGGNHVMKPVDSLMKTIRKLRQDRNSTSDSSTSISPRSANLATTASADLEVAEEEAEDSVTPSRYSSRSPLRFFSAAAEEEDTTKLSVDDVSYGATSP